MGERMNVKSSYSHLTRPLPYRTIVFSYHLVGSELSEVFFMLESCENQSLSPLGPDILDPTR